MFLSTFRLSETPHCTILPLSFFPKTQPHQIVVSSNDIVTWASTNPDEFNPIQRRFTSSPLPPCFPSPLPFPSSLLIPSPLPHSFFQLTQTFFSRLSASFLPLFSIPPSHFLFFMRCHHNPVTKSALPFAQAFQQIFSSFTRELNGN